MAKSSSEFYTEDKEREEGEREWGRRQRQKQTDK